jgi:hypothetical protein
MTLRPSEILSKTRGNWWGMHSRERTGSGFLFVLFGCRFRRRSTALGPEEVSNVGHGGNVAGVLVDNWRLFGRERCIYEDPFSFCRCWSLGSEATMGAWVRLGRCSARWMVTRFNCWKGVAISWRASKLTKQALLTHHHSHASTHHRQTNH